MTGNDDTEKLDAPDPEEMSHEELQTAWKKINKKLQTPIEDPDLEVQLHVLKQEYWMEMQDRTDAEPPECPECNAKNWSQTPGDPKICMRCNKELGMADAVLIEAIDEYWQTVKSASEPA